MSRWTRHTGDTQTGNTGPSAAAVGSYYVYAETSAPNVPSKRFTMTQDFGEGIATVIFMYHMWGKLNPTSIFAHAHTPCNPATPTNPYPCASRSLLPSRYIATALLLHRMTPRRRRPLPPPSCQLHPAHRWEYGLDRAVRLG